MDQLHGLLDSPSKNPFQISPMANAHTHMYQWSPGNEGPNALKYNRPAEEAERRVREQLSGEKTPQSTQEERKAFTRGKK